MPDASLKKKKIVVWQVWDFSFYNLKDLCPIVVAQLVINRA